MNTFNQSTLSQKVIIAISLAVLLFGIVLGITYGTTAYANNGVHVSTEPNSGTVGVGSTVDVWFTYPSSGTTTATSTNVTSPSCMVNGVDIKNSFHNVSPGVYKATYIVSANNASVHPGQLPINCTLSGNPAITVTSFDNGNNISINAGAFASNNTGTSTATTTNSTGTSTTATSTATTTNSTNTNGTSTNATSTATTTPSNNTSTSTATTTIGTTTNSLGGIVTGGTNFDNGVLAIRSISQVRGVATAGGGFSQGWAWMFNLTVPTTESNLQLKFNDWLHSNGSSTIPVANNMRISSVQSNSTTTTMLTGSGVYSSPIILNADLDAALPGRQVQVLVEMQVPSGSVNGSYTTGYGIQSFE